MNKEMAARAFAEMLTANMEVGREARRLAFEDEEMAITYAQRIARLKPGDIVGTGFEGGELRPCVFLGLEPKGRCRVMEYDDEKSKLESSNVGVCCLHLDFPWPPRREQEEEK